MDGNVEEEESERLMPFLRDFPLLAGLSRLLCLNVVMERPRCFGSFGPVSLIGRGLDFPSTDKALTDDLDLPRSVRIGTGADGLPPLSLGVAMSAG